MEIVQPALVIPAQLVFVGQALLASTIVNSMVALLRMISHLQVLKNFATPDNVLMALVM
jgi:hypothetical protein